VRVACPPGVLLTSEDPNNCRPQHDAGNSLLAQAVVSVGGWSGTASPFVSRGLVATALRATRSFGAAAIGERAPSFFSDASFWP
jgi:hypothetical protein